MKRHLLTLLSALTLIFCSLSCQQSLNSPDTPAPVPPAATSAYLFEGNPGIPTSIHDDVTGQLTGTIGGETLSFGPDQADPILSKTGYNIEPTVLILTAKNTRHYIDLGLRGPFRVGSYRVVSNGREQDEPGTVLASIGPPRSLLLPATWTEMRYATNRYASRLSRPTGSKASFCLRSINPVPAKSV